MTSTRGNDGASPTSSGTELMDRLHVVVSSPSSLLGSLP